MSKDKKGGIFIATESFSTTIDGEPYVVRKDHTKVREGHELIRRNPEYFKSIEEVVHFELEDKKPRAEGSNEPEKPKVEVPDGVVPGETPGWPVDAETGEPLDLTDEQRKALAQAEIDDSETEMAVGEAGGAQDERVDLSEKKRHELDEIAQGLGIENPDKLPNKGAVIEAIEAAQKSAE